MKAYVLIIGILAAAAAVSCALTTEAGIFFRRCDGAPRTPVRTILRAAAAPVKAVAERRESRGAPVVFPRLRRAAAGSGSCSTAAAAKGGSCPGGYWQNGKLICPVK